MTIQELQQMTQAQIASNKDAVLFVFNEYKQITGENPKFCDCQLRVYIKKVLKYYGNKNL